MYLRNENSKEQQISNKFWETFGHRDCTHKFSKRGSTDYGIAPNAIFLLSYSVSNVNIKIAVYCVTYFKEYRIHV